MWRAVHRPMASLVGWMMRRMKAPILAEIT